MFGRSCCFFHVFLNMFIRSCLKESSKDIWHLSATISFATLSDVFSRP